MTFRKLFIIDADKSRAQALQLALAADEGVRPEVFVAPVPMRDAILRHLPEAVLLNLTGLSAEEHKRSLEDLHGTNVPAAVFTDLDDPEALQHAMAVGVGAYVVNGYEEGRVPAVIRLAVARHKIHQKLNSDLDKAKAALEDRKTIERAKGLLMARRGLDEAGAYALLRRSAMNQGRAVADMAASVLSAAELLE